jgi:hypothetical protein
VKLTAVNLETGKLIDLTPLMISGGNESLAGDNLFRLEQLAAAAGTELVGHEDADGNIVYDTDQLISAVTAVTVWARLGARFDEWRGLSVNTLAEVIEPVSEDELAELSANRGSSPS